MSGDLVLITGGTGLIGFRVIVEALQAGYQVRAAIRSQSKVELILNAPSIKKLNPGGNLTFVVVPDILEDGAYDKAVSGVKYIIHIASPVPSALTPEQYETHLVQPAVKGTVGLLDSAAKVDGIKRIVITSSNAAITSFIDLAVNESSTVFTGDMRTQADDAPYGNVVQAYCASKVKALLATDKFFAENKPSFDHVNILPSFVIGHTELATNPEEVVSSSNGVVMNQVLGKSNPIPVPGTTVHIDDVAKIHILALKPKILGGQNFVTSSHGVDGIKFIDAKEIIAKNFPKAVASGVLPNTGLQPTKGLKLDSSAAEEAFGIKFAGFEEQIKSLVGCYLDVLGVAKE